MQSGVYGSYPKRRTFRKSLGKRRSRYSGYTAPRSINPINQFTYRKTKVGRLTKTNMQQLKTTTTLKVILSNGSTLYTNTVGTQYFNLSTILAGSPEFVSRCLQYSYYKISGMACTFTRRWIDPITLGVNGVSPGFLNLSNGLSMLSCNFYPNLINGNVGQPVEDADSSWKVSPFIYGTQTHYQPFPNNLSTGVGSNGLGVWNPCTQYSNIYGELAYYNDGGVSVSDQSDMAIWDLEVNCYVSFCNNTGN
nr:MAG: capsid protein [Cressdnaviricota sp.]